MELTNFITVVYDHAAHNALIQLTVIAVIFDAVFGIIRAIGEKMFNSSIGIDGIRRKAGILASLVLFALIDEIIQLNLIGFVPEEVRMTLGLESIGMTGFFALLFLAYEVTSILKNMSLCGLPVKGVWIKVRSILGKYTDELPETIEDIDSK